MTWRSTIIRTFATALLLVRLGAPSQTCEAQTVGIKSNDSPLKIRGGSVHALTPNGFVQLPNTGTFKTDVGTMSANQITLSGVQSIDTDASATPPPVDAKDLPPKTTTTNWMIRLWFRDGLGKEKVANRDKDELDICSEVSGNDKKCSPAATGSPTKLVYLTTGTGSTLGTEKLERANLRYRMKAPPSDKAERIYRMRVSGIPGLNGDYRCVDGLCDIKIEHH